MLKKFSVTIFLLLCLFSYFFVARIHIQEDIHRLNNNSSSEKFYEAELFFPVDLKDHTPEEITSTMLALSDKYKVNIHFEKYEIQPNTGYQGRYGEFAKANNRVFQIYLYAQESFILENLNIKNYKLNNFHEFNDKVGYELSNKDTSNNIGYIKTAHPQDIVTITTLKGYQGDLIGKFILSSTEQLRIEGFLNEVADEYSDISPFILSPFIVGDWYNSLYNPKNHSIYLLRTYYQELMLLFILFVLTSMLYVYNEKRAILIKKISGYQDIQLFAEYILKLLIPGIALSLPLFFITSFIQFRGVSPKLFHILATYYLFIFIIICIFIICALPIYLHIIKIKGIEIISYRENNYIFLFMALITKAIMVPILLTALAISISDFGDLIEQRDDYGIRSELYQNYITFEYLSNNSNLFAGDYSEQETYIERFPQILAKNLNIYIYQPASPFSDNESMGEYMITANANFINDSNLLDIDGKLVMIDSEKNYVLIPEKFEEELRNRAKNFPGTDGKLENYFHDFNNNPVEIIILKNDQKIKAFDGNEVGGYKDGYSYNNIIFSSYHINSPRDIYIDSTEIPNNNEQIHMALADEGIELYYSIENVKDLYQLELDFIRDIITENLFIAILYTFLMAYISVLSIYLYFRTKQKEIYIKTLHGSYVTSNFKDLLSLNFLVNGLIFVYMYWIKFYEGSYEAIYLGSKVPQSLPYAFSFLMLADIIFIIGAIWYVKSRTLAEAVKKGL